MPLELTPRNNALPNARGCCTPFPDPMDGFLVSHVIASVEVIDNPPAPTAEYRLLPNAKAFIVCTVGVLLTAHVMASVDVEIAPKVLANT
jgi:hypothetical protein